MGMELLKLQKLNKKQLNTLLKASLIAFIVLYVFVFIPLKQWVANNTGTFIAIIVFLVLLVIVSFYLKWKIDEKKNVDKNKHIETEKRRQIEVIIVQNKNKWLSEGRTEDDMKKLAEDMFMSQNGSIIMDTNVDPDFLNVLTTLREKFPNRIRGEKLRDESEFQKMIKLFLESKFQDSGYIINKEEYVGKGRPDIVMTSKFGKKFLFELKFADYDATMIRGEDEILRYKHTTQNVAVLIYDPQKGISASKLNDYKNRFEKDLKVEVIIFQS